MAKGFAGNGQNWGASGDGRDRSIHQHDQSKWSCGAPEDFLHFRASAFHRGYHQPSGIRADHCRRRIERLKPRFTGSGIGGRERDRQSGGITGSKIDWHISTDLKAAGRRQPESRVASGHTAARVWEYSLNVRNGRDGRSEPDHPGAVSGQAQRFRFGSAGRSWRVRFDVRYHKAF